MITYFISILFIANGVNVMLSSTNDFWYIMGLINVAGCGAILLKNFIGSNPNDQKENN